MSADRVAHLAGLSGVGRTLNYVVAVANGVNLSRSILVVCLTSF